MLRVGPRALRPLLARPLAPGPRHLSTFEAIYIKVVNSPAAHWIETSLASVHDTTGLPWWGTILLSTALLRTTVTLPAHVTQHKVAAKRLLLGHQMNTEILPELNKAVNRRVAGGKMTKLEAKQEFNKIAKMIHTEKVRGMNCHIFKLTTPIVIQIPVWVMSSVALRNMVTMRYQDDWASTNPVEERLIQLATEGPLWCSNLSLPDPTLLLPVIVGGSFALNIWISGNRLKTAAGHLPTRAQTVLTGALYTLSLAMVPLAAYQPSAVALYWATSGVMAVILNLLLMEPRFRRAVRIPWVEQEPREPYTVLGENARKALRLGGKL